MTVIRVTQLLYTGLHSDTKPVTAAIGSVFIETDHHQEFLWNGVDWVEREQVRIAVEHQRVHNGEMWMIGSGITVDVANDANLDLVVTVPAGIELHTIGDIDAEGKAYFMVYEAPTLGAGGSPAVVRNANRTSGDAGAPTVSVGQTISAVGTLLSDHVVPGGTGGNAGGTSTNRDGEIILKAETSYLFRVTNKKGNDSDISLNLLSYEHVH